MLTLTPVHLGKGYWPVQTPCPCGMYKMGIFAREHLSWKIQTGYWTIGTLEKNKNGYGQGSIVFAPENTKMVWVRGKIRKMGKSSVLCS